MDSKIVLWVLVAAAAICCGGTEVVRDESSLRAYTGLPDCVTKAKNGISYNTGKYDIVLLPTGSATECADNFGKQLFTVAKGKPQKVVLYGDPDEAYCVGVERLKGYITISHDDGDVHRRDNMFSWCVIPNGTNPPSMAVQSLTYESQFRLILF